MALNGFYLSRLSLQLKAVDALRLPSYKGSTFRGGFGNAFKRVVCVVKNKPCSMCNLRQRCIYSYVFETPPPEETDCLRKYTNIPHPFIIEPPEDGRCDFEPGDTLTFNLILIGRAVEYLPYFIYTFEELGRIGIGKGRGRYELQDVRCEGQEIYNSIDRQLRSELEFGVMSIEEALKTKNSILNSHNFSTITLSFLTPARIVVNGDLVVDLEFHHLIRNLLRRISNLSYFHCGKKLDIDFKRLIEKAEKVAAVYRDLRWHDWERYSARQDTKMKFGGFIGVIGFSGALEPFIPFLTLGEVIHIGKGTSFGLGRYRLTTNSNPLPSGEGKR